MSQKLVAILMGSASDAGHLASCRKALDNLGISHEAKVLSAHRTPDRLYDYAEGLLGRGMKVIIAGAGGAAHLPGMVASKTILPVIGVPIKSEALNGIDSLYSIVQMPAGFPVATMAIGKAGAINAAVLAASILALENVDIEKSLERWRTRLSKSIPHEPEEPKDV